MHEELIRKVLEKPLDKLAKEIREVNKKNNWDIVYSNDWQESNHKIPAVLSLIHSEVSEGLEEFRKDNREEFLEEMADVVIRVLDCVGGLTDNFENIVIAKLNKNRNRGTRHGGKRV